MAAKNLLYYYKKAEKEGWALPQFNFSTADQLKGIVEGALLQKAPLLVGTSEGDSAFIGKAQAVALVESYRKETKLPIFLNFDHGKSVESVREAMEAGYDAVHFDGSAFPFAENVKLTKKVVALAKKHGIVLVEGEYAEIPGLHSTFHKGKTPKLGKGSFTDPKEAREFVRKTGVTSLAVLVGTVHGVYKRNPRLDIELLSEIKKHVTSFMVLHGGSGTLKADLLSAVKTGVVKVNVSTELRAAFVNTLRTTLNNNKDEVTPYNVLPPSVEAVRKVTEEKLQFLGSSNKA